MTLLGRSHFSRTRTAILTQSVNYCVSKTPSVFKTLSPTFQNTTFQIFVDFLEKFILLGKNSFVGKKFVFFRIVRACR